MKYFGTDGIRGIVGKKITPNLLKKVAKALVKYYSIHNLNKIILIGNDSRVSSDYISSIMQSVLLRYGIQIENVGVCSSPCLAYLTKRFNYPLSIMISASHNSKEYNGIKFFNSKGEKCGDDFEIKLENFIGKRTNTPTSFAHYKNVENLKQNYISYLKRIKKSSINCIFDCAFGGTSDIVKILFPKHEKLHINYNGNNINENAGCMHIETLQSICRIKKKIGFAFDGDGDRITVISEKGNVISGDKILYILSKFYLKSGDNLIGTLYTNSGLEKALKSRNINLIRAKVGDKYVYEKMKETSSILGGEDAGHIIMRHFSNTGDGLLIAILISNIVHMSKLSLEELVSGYNEHYQATANIENKTLSQTSIQNLIEKFSPFSRVIIRPSGTEPVIRILVESENENNAKEILNKLLLEIKNIN